MLLFLTCFPSFTFASPLSGFHTQFFFFLWSFLFLTCYFLSLSFSLPSLLLRLFLPWKISPCFSRSFMTTNIQFYGECQNNVSVFCHLNIAQFRCVTKTLMVSLNGRSGSKERIGEAIGHCIMNTLFFTITALRLGKDN